MTVLSDSSPLITLSKIGRLDLLPQLYETVTITPEVYAEVVVGGAGLAGSSQISTAKWILAVAVLDGTAEESAVVPALRESMAKGVLGDAGFAFGGARSGGRLSVCLTGGYTASVPMNRSGAAGHAIAATRAIPTSSCPLPACYSEKVASLAAAPCSTLASRLYPQSPCR